jgi:hypothetical protein
MPAHTRLSYTGVKLRHSLTTSSVAAAVLLLSVLGLGMYGMGRSLWLDEAWVANSVQAPALSGMFYYPGWLQVNPPLFLLLVRGAVWLLGASNVTFRMVPLLLAGVAAACTLGVSRHFLRVPLAALATAIVVLDPTAIDYSRMLKPYSGEFATSAALLLLTVRYLQQPDRRRFGWLMAAVVVSIPLAYSTVFLLPGIVLAVAAATRKSRGVWLGGVAGSVLVAVLLFSVRPNLAPELREFWAVGADHGMNAGLLVVLLFCCFAAIRSMRILAQGSPSPRVWTQVICVLPCLLLAAAGGFGWYPVSHRTRLFAVPCFVLLVMLTVEDLFPYISGRKIVDVAAAALTFGLVCFAVSSQIIESRAGAEEDFAGAVAFLQHRVSPSDLVLVHACCKEGFLLYSAMDRWNPPHVLFGDTGWPCCARGKDARPGTSSAAAVIQDLDSKIPPRYSGRVWLLYTTRPTHWSYTGLDEGDLWRTHLWDRGCPPGPYLRFANLAVSPMNCTTH